jgi:hypothetical protein
VTDLITAAEGPLKVCGSGNFQYVLRPGPVLEHRFPIRFFAEGMRLKLNGFRRQWNAAIVSRDDNSFVCRVEAARSLWQRWVGGQAGLEVQVCVSPDGQPDARLAEATVHIKPFGGAGAEDAERLMAAAPALLESLRSYLQVSSERRGQERWPCAHPLQVSPVLPDLEVAGEIAGTAKDLSLNGISFLVPQTPPSDRLYLRVNTGAEPAEFALLARVVHIRHRADGLVEVGAAFFTDNA